MLIHGASLLLVAERRPSSEAVRSAVINLLQQMAKKN